MADDRRVVVGVFPTRAETEDALAALREAGFDQQDVSILTQNPDQSLPPDGQSGTTNSAAAGAVAGGMAGAFAGWVLGAGALLIPGVGPFIAAGAIASALTGAALGAGLGAVGGALTGMGVPEEEAHWYAQQVHGGSTLVTVDAGSRFDEAQEILRRHGSQDVRTRDRERVGYGVAGGSSSMEPDEHGRADAAGVETATPGLASMRAHPATAATPSGATPSRDVTPRP